MTQKIEREIKEKSSITTLTADNGLLKRANYGKNETQRATVEENIELEVLGGYDETGKINMYSLNIN